MNATLPSPALSRSVHPRVSTESQRCLLLQITYLQSIHLRQTKLSVKTIHCQPWFSGTHARSPTRYPQLFIQEISSYRRNAVREKAIYALPSFRLALFEHIRTQEHRTSFERLRAFQHPEQPRIEHIHKLEVQEWIARVYHSRNVSQIGCRKCFREANSSSTTQQLLPTLSVRAGSMVPICVHHRSPVQIARSKPVRCAAASWLPFCLCESFAQKGFH